MNYVLSPPAGVTPMQQLQFQQRLADPVTGVIFDATQKDGAANVFVRGNPALQVRIGPVGPQVGQFLITAPNPDRSIEDFIEEAQSVVQAYRDVWPSPIQVLRRDCTVRHLYAVREPHAFAFLWERRLHQPQSSVEAFGRQILGGGLRFVMPPRPEVPDDMQVEVKIESLLADASQLFVEASMVWPQPESNAELDPASLVNTVESFLNYEVTNFILSE